MNRRTIVENQTESAEIFPQASEMYFRMGRPRNDRICKRPVFLPAIFLLRAIEQKNGGQKNHSRKMPKILFTARL
jgi:hypothetical protein